MAVNTAKQRMLEGKPAIGGEVGLGSIMSAELLAGMAFDFVIVDNQHGAWDEQSTMSAFRSIALGPSIPMARVAKNDYGRIGRLLDMGALGVVVPMVNSAEEARAAATAVRYPPLGSRSSGAFGAGFWGPDYDEWIDREVFLAVQIETVEGVEAAEEIMGVDGIDGCWIGPGDLGRSLGVDRSTKEGADIHTDTIRRIIAACQKMGKAPGIWTGSAEDCQRWIDEGCLFVTVGPDKSWVAEGASQALKKLGRGT